LLIENGWDADLIEPSKIYFNLEKTYDFLSFEQGFSKEKSGSCELEYIKIQNEQQILRLFNIAIGNENGFFKFYESGSILENKEDKNLVSSFKPEQRWAEVTSYTERLVECLTFKSFVEKLGEKPIWDIVSIDAEGYDLNILTQIDLDYHEVQCVCVEWNGQKELDEKLTKYCNNFGLYEEERNAENIIFVR
jgi:FkbM family methyltransferase